MDSILFEHQEAALCAQHALNMLLQNPLFSVSELREIAQTLDRAENSVLDAAGQNTQSQNMNDSGFFSIQVISEALKPFDLQIHNIDHPSMVEYKRDPLKARAFLCNLREHWFVLRRFGNQWFELNSVKPGPVLMSDTYVSVFLRQLNLEDYSHFVVVGILPPSEADQLITLCPIETPPIREAKPKGKIEAFIESMGKRLGSSSNVRDNNEDTELAVAMAMSMDQTSHSFDNDNDYQAALRASIMMHRNDVLDKSGQEGSSSAPVIQSYEEAELDDYEKAIRMSLADLNSRPVDVVRTREVDPNNHVHGYEEEMETDERRVIIAPTRSVYVPTNYEETPILQSSSPPVSHRSSRAPSDTCGVAASTVVPTLITVNAEGNLEQKTSSLFNKDPSPTPSSSSSDPSTSDSDRSRKPSAEQQRKDREAFLKRFEKK